MFGFWSGGFHSPYIKVECPDGPRFILRNPEGAFSVAFADWDARIKAVIGAFQAVEARLEIGAAKKFKSLVQNLGKNYAMVQAHYQAAYLQYAANPCSKESNQVLAAANQEIRGLSTELKEIEITTEEVMELMEPKKRVRWDYVPPMRRVRVILGMAESIDSRISIFQPVDARARLHERDLSPRTKSA